MTECNDKFEWIWTPDGEEVNQYVEFRDTFSLNELPTDTVNICISADSRYVAYINGVYLPVSQYADYPNYKIYDSLDITKFVKKGENVVAIIAYFQGEDSSVYRKGQAGLMFCVSLGNRILTQSNANTLCRISHTYESGAKVEKFTNQLSYSFRYNAVVDDEWQKENYIVNNLNGWKKAVTVSKKTPLEQRPILPLQVLPPKDNYILSQGVFFDNDKANKCGDRMQNAALKFKKAEELGFAVRSVLPNEQGVVVTNKEGDGVYLIIDLGCEECGYISFDIELKDNTEILIGFGEHLDDLRVRTSIDGRQFAAVYNAKQGRQKFSHYFKRVACRYMCLQVYAPEIKIYYAGLLPVKYPVKYKKEFHCADALHNRIFEVSRRTLELCMHEHYEDCPWREQALYAMDSRNQMWAGYYVFDNPEFALASLKLLALGIREDGLLELCAPSKLPITIPCFSLSFVSAVYECFLFTKDENAIKKLLPTVEIILSTFVQRKNDNGLVPCFTGTEYWNFYEWSEYLDGGSIYRDEEIETTYDAPLNAMLVLALVHASKLYSNLGNYELSKEYSNEAQKTIEALEQFWNADDKMYADYITEKGLFHYSELTNAIIGCVIPEGEKGRRIREVLSDEKSGIEPITLSSMQFKYDALMQDGDLYASWIKNDIEKHWGYMLFNGATSFWETIKGAWDFDRAGSLCHGWSTVPLYFYYRYVLGLDPQTEDAKPYFCGLYDAKLR